MKLNRFDEDFGNLLLQHKVADDFHWYISPHMWTSLVDDAGSSVAVTANTDAGILLLTTGAVDNNEVGFASTNAMWKFGAGKTIYAETLLQFTEAGSGGNNANVAFGFTSAFSANLLVDNGAGPATSHTGAMIYKVDGGTVWRGHTSNSTTQTSTAGLKTAGGLSYQRLGIEMRDVDGTNMEVTFFVDNLPLLADDGARRPIKHYVAISSASAMKLFVYTKAGDGASQTVSVDYIAAVKAR